MRSNKSVKAMLDDVGGTVFAISTANKYKGINKQQVFFRKDSKFQCRMSNLISIDGNGSLIAVAKG